MSYENTFLTLNTLILYSTFTTFVYRYVKNCFDLSKLICHFVVDAGQLQARTTWEHRATPGGSADGQGPLPDPLAHVFRHDHGR